MSKDYTLKEALSKSSKDLYKAMDEARNAASTPKWPLPITLVGICNSSLKVIKKRNRQGSIASRREKV